SEEAIKKVAQNFEGYDLDWLDGLSVRTPDFWLNLRPSNTEPLLRLNIEAKNELILNRVKAELVSIIRPFLK
ncbi:phosphomannomutase/phosphoglucomutase, partial [Patescibacteria group bacterium]|nr:phosphomannomutase/phosphoglucomutase [Patescibacteria group bacterium]